MVVVDFSNPFLRTYFDRWLAAPRAKLGNVARILEKSLASVSAKPPAVVLVIDEVLLCNMHMNGFADADVDFHVSRYFAKRDGSPWWTDVDWNPALPGAIELLQSCKDWGVAVFMVTGRDESLRDETVENFEIVGFVSADGDAPLAAEDLEERLIMCPGLAGPDESVQPFKQGARARIAKKYDILANVGDQASDLGDYGERQIFLPHPFYYTR